MRLICRLGKGYISLFLYFLFLLDLKKKVTTLSRHAMGLEVMEFFFFSLNHVRSIELNKNDVKSLKRVTTVK